ncbi:transcriptional regulator, ArsR family [Renibacterium salmoninarum ATCC 33209]|uniref:Transcriptional regulator, ArsR family n=1 Tax=Renibacterium salmoninarum (strain ATCC 33209 / DSM 20767 / JCM 11484 / NBRC 15589 / NCIMB 2235) TaxID=288705 RepID=A9WSX7_RENSM|nr:metalloregulator ArsR/SmtB family transcription factor [Renibacterium salmoninarum]ABY23915.1 transcriptional regulator, ArsR family [Renibacterium salmoninarum ATCC 33209]
MKLSNEHAEDLAQVMQALSSPGRLLILARLDDSPCSVSTLVEDCGMAQATISNHLRILRHLDLVTGQREGRQVIYSLYDAHVQEFFRQALGHIGHS